MSIELLLKKQKDHLDLRYMAIRLIIEEDYAGAQAYLDRVINFDWSS